MSGKTARRFLFDVNLNWIAGTQGILSSKNVDGRLHVAAPASFGGEGKPWTPEHLLLGAVSSCFMTTCLFFARKNQFSFSGISCEAIGQIEYVSGRLKFTAIDLYPVVTIPSEQLREKAAMILNQATRYCLVTNSLDVPVFYHTELILEPAVPVDRKAS